MRRAAAMIGAASLWLAAPAAAADAPVFVPEKFFAGRTAGDGSLRVLLGPARALKVRSRGRIMRDGTLVLTQRIEQDGEAPRSRVWRLRKLPEGRYAATLSDAVGPVSAEVTGSVLRVRYTMKGRLGLAIDQRLELEPDGRTVRNRLTASKLGLPVARVRETIRKLR